MKIQIRKNCFETNSSSTHAICITKAGVDMNNLPKHVTFEHGEFGWENAEYSSVYSKASYLYQAICDCNYERDDKKEEMLNRISELLGTYGISCDFEESSDKTWGDGYIDHAGETIDFVTAVLEDDDKLLRYLFGDSMIITGNDNSDDYSERMYVREGEDVYDWGVFPRYGGLKPEFDDYEVYRKGN